MLRPASFLVLVALLASAGCGSSSPSRDFTTPEGAILCLEEAYRQKDLEAAVACRDFDVEAQVMLKKINAQLADDPEILKKTAEVLELGYRAEIRDQGFPDFADAESSFPSKEPLDGHPNLVRVKEVCRFPGGVRSENDLVVAKTDKGWKVISFPDLEEQE